MVLDTTLRSVISVWNISAIHPLRCCVGYLITKECSVEKPWIPTFASIHDKKTICPRYDSWIMIRFSICKLPQTKPDPQRVHLSNSRIKKINCQCQGARHNVHTSMSQSYFGNTKWAYTIRQMVLMLCLISVGTVINHNNKTIDMWSESIDYLVTMEYSIGKHLFLVFMWIIHIT